MQDAIIEDDQPSAGGITPERAEDILAALDAIEQAANKAAQTIERAAAEHRAAFDFQMRELVGVEKITLDESYLKREIERFQSRLLERLSKLVERFTKAIDRVSEKKALSIQDEIVAEIQQRLEKITINTSREMKQELDDRRQRAFGIRYYIWRSSDDERVRSTHAINDDQLFDRNNPPPTGKPVDDFGCRCWPEPTYPTATEEEVLRDAIEPVYPELLIPAARIAGVIKAGVKKAKNKIDDLLKKPEPRPKLKPKPKPKPKKPEAKPEKPRNNVEGSAEEISKTRAKVDKAIEATEKYLGGKGRVVKNKHGDTIVTKGNKKVRIDLKNTGGDKPHFHIERKTSGGKWKDAGKDHRYYFKE